MPPKIFYDGWDPILRTLVLGTLGYIGLVILLRISGKRTLSKMNAFDFVVTVAFGSTLAALLTNKGVSLAQGIAALALLVGLQFIATALSVRSDAFRRLLKSEPQLLYHRGEFLDRVMRRQRITRDEVFAAMRSSGVTDPDTVDAVVLEAEGTLTVLRAGSDSAVQLAALGVDVDRPAT